MKERPIIFSGAMVRAILEGRKTQTRRIIKANINHFHIHGNPRKLLADWGLSGLRELDKMNGQVKFDFQTAVDDYSTETVKCPYGQPGDWLWVRETWQPNTMPTGWSYYYRATDEEVVSGPWKSPIFMPRVASRILLEITDVRVERVQEITRDDAITEGVGALSDDYTDGMDFFADAVDAFRSLWRSIHGSASWEQNPWVWVITFSKIIY